MAGPTVRSVSAVASISGASTLTVTKPAGTVSGDILVIFEIAGTQSITTPFSGFTDQTTSDLNWLAGALNTRQWTKVAGGSEPANYSIVYGGNQNATGVAVACQPNAGGTCALDALLTGGTRTGTGTAVSMTAFTTGVADALALGQITAITPSKTFTPGSGWTEVLDNSNITIISKPIPSAGSTGTVDCTISGSDSWAGVALSVKETGGTTLGIPPGLLTSSFPTTFLAR